MTLEEEVGKLIDEFYNVVGDFNLAKKCVRLHVNLLISSLEKNKGYTQCTIDLEHYEEVKNEIDNFD